MKKLIQISNAYHVLKVEYENALISPFEIEEVQKGNPPKCKQLEKECEKLELQFIQAAKAYRVENQLSNKAVVIQMTDELLNSNFQSIHQYLLIRLMWDLMAEQNQFCLKSIEKWLRQILSEKQIGHKEEYYLESLIDIWYEDTNELIPIDILEKIILANMVGATHGALVKAVAYLSNHPENESTAVLAKARLTVMYKEDEYYRDWID